MARVQVGRLAVLLGAAPCALLALLAAYGGQPAPRSRTGSVGAESYGTAIRPLLRTYCLACHSSAAKQGGLDLERFRAPEEARRDLKAWQGVIEHLEAGDMPPKGSPQPTAPERRRILGWAQALLAGEARAQAGDPGYVPLRRLSNAEFDRTIQDLTGVDLRPTREFPADGAAGEGFTNAAESLTEISPSLLTKYFNAAKEISDHVVLLPDGFRFSAAKTRRDWTDESTARLRAFYANFTGPEGRLEYAPYLAALLRRREALAAGRLTLDQVAAQERLNPKYLRTLWQALTDNAPSYPLDAIRTRWRTARAGDAPALAAEIAERQAALWRTVRVGNYIRAAGTGFEPNAARQVPVDPPVAETQRLQVTVKPIPGQSEVALTLASRELIPGGGKPVVWGRPRLEAPGRPSLLLRDYAQFGPGYELDLPSAFAQTSRYLAAAVEAANHPERPVEEIAQAGGLDTAFLRRWISTVAVDPYDRAGRMADAGRPVPAVALDLLDEPIRNDGSRPAINGWRRKGNDLPILVTNRSDTVEHIPGTASPHAVAVHPTPTEFVAAVWKSPVSGAVRIRAKVTHAHPACGNGVAWWLEHRHGDRAAMFAEGAIELGGSASPGERILKVSEGDLILLAVDAKDGNHGCDLTEIALDIAEAGASGYAWSLAGDIADTVLAGNPHADRYGGRGVWSFVKGPTRPVGSAAEPLIPPASLLGRWQAAAADPARKAEAAQLGAQADRLLSGRRPAGAEDPDRLLYDHLVTVGSPLLQDLADSPKMPGRPAGRDYGLAKARFGAMPRGSRADDASLETPAGEVVTFRLPAALFQGRTFIVDAGLEGKTDRRAVAFEAQGGAPGAGERGAVQSAIVAAPGGAAARSLREGFDRFRRLFPLFLSFPQVIPNDEVVSLKLFHREDEPLRALFLSDAQARDLDRLWAEHRFIGRQPALENAQLPLFIGFVTQDQPKEMVAFFEGQRPAFRSRAEALLRDEQAAIPKQMEALSDWTAKAYRRPLTPRERGEQLHLYRTLRAKGASHEEAFRGVLARVCVAPAFLFRIEQAPAGARPGRVNDWELATRLSYFLWSSAPDEALRREAAAGRLHEPPVLAAQTRRMLRDPRLRSLAIEFGAQWLHVRGFDTLNEKNETLFPTFDAGLRGAIYEETLLFFQDLFQSDRPVTRILDADYTFLNETLAKHYGIPGVTGPQWRRVDGVRRYGRGGVLGLASVQAKEAGASRTSPVLRGNWLVETLLGEKLPRPPANVPQLPEQEGVDGLTTRQQVEKHARVPSCAVCHKRIDPFGFALENYDAIGRYREREPGGRPVDTRAKLQDGTQFEGIDGLRAYLMTAKQEVIVRLFCRRLLGYALGRSVTNSDQPLIDTMTADLRKSGGRVSAAVQAIVLSPQFRMIRGREFAGSR